MKTVFKYPMPRMGQKFSLILPIDFKFIRTHLQSDQRFFWAEVVPETKTQQYDFALYGTGHEIPMHAKHLTSYDEGPFVLHLYQL